MTEQDPIIEATRGFAPEQPTQSSALDGLIGNGRVFRFGATVRVVLAPNPDLIGTIGTVQPPHRAASPLTIASFVVGLDAPYEILAGSAWDFADVPETTTSGRRAREVYDAKAFAEDVDLAINYIRSVALEERQTVAIQPHFPEGVSARNAIARVCDTLVLRKFTAYIYEQVLDEVLADARKMLITKNENYGNSALSPVRIFSKASLKEQLLVRLDDKVSRLVRGQAAGEDVAGDMLGYLLLVAIAEKRERESP